MWRIVRKSQFEKQYKLLGSERQKKTDGAILDLAYSTNPATKGQYKSGIRVFASGKLVCAGTRKEPEVYRAVHNLHAVLQEKGLMSD